MYTTLSDKQLAEQLAEEAVKEKMATCVNIIPGVTSVYIWGGQIEKSQESVLLFKTTQECLKALETWLIKRHPYELPAIIIGKVDCSYSFFHYINDYQNT